MKTQEYDFSTFAERDVYTNVIILPENNRSIIIPELAQISYISN